MAVQGRPVPDTSLDPVEQRALDLYALLDKTLGSEKAIQEAHRSVSELTARLSELEEPEDSPKRKRLEAELLKYRLVHLRLIGVWSPSR
ncbi:MAG: hypothetical protein AAF196_20590 [Planctomycetota bacterium]